MRMTRLLLILYLGLLFSGMVLAWWIIGDAVVAAWNWLSFLAPGLPLYFLWQGQRRLPVERSARRAQLAFCILCPTVALALLAAFEFDWHGTTTGSSTSAIGFIFLPLLAVTAGGLGALIAALLGVSRKGV